ncbi:MAG: DNA methyltransferase [Pseudoxanthomonas suwonensis]|nr:MAG: DNA methyltransferase [Pseudoxanthomonas suwonensis]
MLETTPVTPFLKWAGGKRWLARDYRSLFQLSDKDRYVEPFLGSGAVFFSLLPARALLNDANAELIHTYNMLKDDWASVVALLRRHQTRHCEDYYYAMRGSTPKSNAARAARFLYLNRTCFNGLYRVNRKGQFNVPLGTKTAVLMESDDFEAVARALQGAELASGDFEKIIDACGQNDFVFADPPYTVKHNNNGFVKYNERLFSWSDQERLQAALQRAAHRGARIVVSNADHPSVRELYSGWQVETLYRHSVMASESTRRKRTSEVVMRR